MYVTNNICFDLILRLQACTLHHTVVRPESRPVGSIGTKASQSDTLHVSPATEMLMVDQGLKFLHQALTTKDQVPDQFYLHQFNHRRLRGRIDLLKWLKWNGFHVFDTIPFSPSQSLL